MDNILIILSALDIPAALQAAGHLPEYKAYVFDPHVLDAVEKSGLANIEYFEWEDGLECVALTRWARTTAFGIENELENATRDLLPGVSIQAWQHLNYYYMCLAIRWHTELWNAFLKKLDKARLHVFVYNNPTTYYIHSFIPAVLLLERLKTWGMEFSAYTYGTGHNATDLVPGLSGFAEVQTACELLVHIPTCLYDFRYFSDEILASGKRVLHLESLLWKVTLEDFESSGLKRVEELRGEFGEEFWRRLDAVVDKLQSLLQGILGRHIHTPSYRNQQCAHNASLYRSQLVLFFLLEKHFSHAKPGKLLLSDHDAGFHGPLVSFAERHRIPLLILPHSKTIPDILPYRHGNVLVMAHPMQGTAVANAQGHRLPVQFLTYPETQTATLACPPRFARVGLILNALTLGGVHFTRDRAYLEGIRQIVVWCRDKGIELGIRGRPGHTVSAWLSNEMGIDPNTLLRGAAGSILDFAGAHDLCLMYDTPTSGAIDLLRHSIPVLNPIPEPLAGDEAVIANPAVIPRAGVADTLYRLDGFCADVTNYLGFRHEQFRAYVHLFHGALPLRLFL